MLLCGFDRITDADLIALSDECELILHKASVLALAIRRGVTQFYDQGPRTFGADFDPDVFRADYVLFWPPEDLWRCKLEFDAASENAVLVESGRWYSNWHEASAIFYRLFLNRMWEILLGAKKYGRVHALRDDEPNKAIELMCTLDLERSESRLKEISAELTFDYLLGKAQLEREIARVFQNRSIRPNRDQILGDNQEKDFVAMPDNPDVLDLCKLLGKSRGKIQDGEKSIIEIAREFTKELPGSDSKAQNLARQARRFPHLWKASRK